MLLLLFAALLQTADWIPIAPGIDYRDVRVAGRDIHIARIDLRNECIRVIASTEAERGLRVSEFASRHKAVVAMNGDYFDDKMNPIGLAVGACGTWTGTRDTEREGVAAFGIDHARIDRQREVMDPPEGWIDAAVSGWPM